MADDVLKQFLVSIGFKVDESGQRKFNDALKSAVLQANLLASAIETAAVAVAKSLFGMSESFDKLYFASRRTGASVQNIRALSYAFTQVGGSGGDAAAAVENFAKVMRTNPGVGGFVRSLGVATEAGGKARDTIDVLMDSVDAIRKRNPHFIGAQLAGILGIDEHQFLLLEKSRDEIRKYRAEYDRTARMMGLNNEQAAESHNQLSTSMRSLSMIVTVAADKLLTMLAPALEKVVKAVVSWIEAHPEKIEEIFKGITEAAKWLGEQLAYLADQAIEMSKDGRWLKMWEKTVDLVLKTAEALKSVVHWIGLINNFGTNGNSLSGQIATSILGTGGAQAGEAPKTEAEAAEKPGFWRRALRSVKRAISGGVANAGEGTAGATGTAGGRGGRIGTAQRHANTGAIIGELRAAGYGDNAIAAIVGSMQTESSFNPRASNNIGGGHTGLWQWSSTRWPKIERWIRSQKGDPFDAAWQTKAWVAEHNARPGDPLYDSSSTARGGAMLRNNPSLNEAVTGVRMSERFGPGEEGGRAANARAWLPKVQGEKTGPAWVNPPPKPLNIPKMPAMATPGGFDVNKLTAPVTPMGGASSVDNSSSRTITQNNHTTVKIEAGGDPVAAGRQTERALGNTSALSLRNMQRALA